MARSAKKPKRKIFHATVQVTRSEEWYVEADSVEEARGLLESGIGHRAQLGQCIHFEIDTMTD
jgi:hypothetical protein